MKISSVLCKEWDNDLVNFHVIDGKYYMIRNNTLDNLHVDIISLDLYKELYMEMAETKKCYIEMSEETIDLIKKVAVEGKHYEKQLKSMNLM